MREKSAGASGAVISTQTVKVLGVGAAAPGAEAGTTGGPLSFTDFDGIGLAVVGAVLILVGAGAVLVTRRRRSAQVAA